jgi:23S rRNA (cytosine1962-C5)-methyltransferase
MANSPTLRITRRASDRLRAGHLWIYRSDLDPQHQHPSPEPGSLVTIVDARRIPLGSALYSSASQIAARLVSRTPALDRAQYLSDVRDRVHAAIRLRETLAPISTSTNAHRIIFSEADNLPGIVADRYNDLVILQLLTQGTAQDDVRSVLRETLRDTLAGAHQSLTIWERPDPRIRELEQLAAPPPGALFSTVIDSIAPDGLSFRSETERDAAQRPPSSTTFSLNGLHFHYDAASGQKTGAFLDQRLNYAAAARIVAASGKSAQALDVCTYHGGFALHLADVCANVTGVDSSRAALECAEQNLGLNPHLASKEHVDWIEADAFDYLRHLDQSRTAKGSDGQFDAIVLDPPAFAKSKRAAEAALRGYKELNLRAIRLLSAGGTLVSNSCSHHVSLADFVAVIASAATDAGKSVQLLETHSAAPDHPEILTLPESMYLKCLICRVG